MDNIINAFNSEEEMNEDDTELNNDPLAIKKGEYELLKIIKFFHQQNIIKKRIICEKCSK